MHIYTDAESSKLAKALSAVTEPSFAVLPPLNLLCIYRPAISRDPVSQLGNPSASLVDLHSLK